MKEKGNAKVLWWILFAVLAVVLCYLFLIVYFFCIAPNNISAKLTVWPYLSNQAIGELYEDCIVEVDFSVLDEFGESVEASTVGVNVKENGVIVAPYAKFRQLDKKSPLSIKTNSGKVYAAKLLYSDLNFDLCILKCEIIKGETGKIQIPYAKLKEVESSSVIAVSTIDEKLIASGKLDLSESFPIISLREEQKESLNEQSQPVVANYYALDHLLENCMTLDIKNENFTNGAVFDSKGGFLGFQFVVRSGEYVFQPAYYASLFLEDVLKCEKAGEQYSNEFVNAVHGLDIEELAGHLQVSEMPQENGLCGNEDQFFFEGDWMDYDNSVLNFAAREEENGFYLISHFVIQDKGIAAQNVITSVRVNGTSTTIALKTDLLSVLYTLKSGDNVSIMFLSMAAPLPEFQEWNFVV